MLLPLEREVILMGVMSAALNGTATFSKAWRRKGKNLKNRPIYEHRSSSRAEIHATSYEGTIYEELRKQNDSHLD